MESLVGSVRYSAKFTATTTMDVLRRSTLPAECTHASLSRPTPAPPLMLCPPPPSCSPPLMSFFPSPLLVVEAKLSNIKNGDVETAGS